MPNISGYVYYNATNALSPGTGIANVPVVLYSPSTVTGVTALTDANGLFTFTNVPNGAYQVIEAWGAPGAPTPVDFSTAAPMPTVPAEAEPPLSALSVAPPPLADYLMALSPNLLNVNVSGADVTGLFFYDAPVGSKPMNLNGINLIGPNLITAAANGSFGSVPAGSPVNTIPATAPYPAVTPGFTYYPTPEVTDGGYTIVNIRNRVNPFAWWNLSDHQTRLETGRFMIVNGFNPGAVVFTETITVTPNTYYMMSGWVMNLLNIPGTPPRFSFKVIGSDGTQLGYELLNSLGLTPIPVWYQNGFLFNSAGFSSVTVEIISEAPSSNNGNDYAIDEISLYQAEIIDLLAVQKSMTPSTIYTAGTGVGTPVTVSVNVTNTSAQTVNNVIFQDTLSGLQFVPGSVTVNGSGVGYGTADPNTGFSIGNLAGNATAVVAFQATTTVPGPVTIQNTANATYDAATSGNGDVISRTVTSNQTAVQVIVNKAVLNVTKKADKSFADINDVLTYTLTIQNSGNMAADNVVITDAVPAGTSFVAGSVTGATGTPPTLMLANPIPAGGTATVTFQVLVGNTIPTPNPVQNSATAAFTFTMDPANPNGATGSSTSNVADTQINSAIVTATKTADPSFVDVNGNITYTVTLQNTGSVVANNVVLTDAIPAGTTFVPGSLTGATGTPPTLTLATPLAAGGTSTVTYQVKVGNAVPNPNPLSNTVAAAFTYTVDPTQPNASSGTAVGGPADTQVNTAKLLVSKSADKPISYIGDTITYQIAVQNTGNVNADNVVLTDLLPTGVSYVANSLIVSVPYSGTLFSGLALSVPIAPGQTVTLSFQAKVDTIPNPNPIRNKATAVYTYTVDPANPNGVSATAVSPTATTIVFRNNYSQQVSDLIESVALEQAALAALANAEGAKIQAAVAMGQITQQELLCINKSVADMMDSISMLEAVLKQKLNLVDCQINGTGAGCL